MPTTVHGYPPQAIVDTSLSTLSTLSTLSIAVSAMPQKPSAAHQHFTVVDVLCSSTGRLEQKRQCDPCRRADVDKYFAMSSSTDTLLDHIESQHSAISINRRRRLSGFSFRWQSHHEQQLQAAAVGFSPPIMDMVSVLKKKVMSYVKDLAEQEAQQEVAGVDVTAVS